MTIYVFLFVGLLILMVKTSQKKKKKVVACVCGNDAGR